MKVLDYNELSKLIPEEQQYPFSSHYPLRHYVLSVDNEFEGAYIPERQVVFKFIFDN